MLPMSPFCEDYEHFERISLRAPDVYVLMANARIDVILYRIY